MLKYVWFSIIGFIIAGCACHSRQCMSHSACNPHRFSQVQQQVEAVGGQMVQVGNLLTVTIPSRQLFLSNSTNTVKGSQCLLYKVIQEFSCRPTESIKVASYNGTLPTRRANIALAAQRAHVVANMVRAQKMTRIVYEDSQSDCSAKNKLCQLNRVELATQFEM